MTDRAHLNFELATILYRFAGRPRLVQAVPLLRHILSKETNFDILTPTIRCIGDEKLEELTDEVAEFIFYDDDYLKAEAVDALENLGTPLALSRLEQCARTEKCDANILETITSLKSRLKEKSQEKGEHSGS